MTDELTVLEAYTDGAVSTDGVAGWGVWLPGPPELAMCGVLESADPMIAELWAVLMAVKRSPKQSRLTIHTDAQSLPKLLTNAAPHVRDDIRGVTSKILAAAQRRAIELTISWNSREIPAQQMAHHLAVTGRERGKGRRPHASIIVRPSLDGVFHLTVEQVTGRTTKRSSFTWLGSSSRANLQVALDILDAIRSVELRVEGEGINRTVALGVLRTLQAEAPHLNLMLSHGHEAP